MHAFDHHIFLLMYYSGKWNTYVFFLGYQSVIYIMFTQPLRSGRIWHKVNFLSGV